MHKPLAGILCYTAFSHAKNKERNSLAKYLSMPSVTWTYLQFADHRRGVGGSGVAQELREGTKPCWRGVGSPGAEVYFKRSGNDHNHQFVSSGFQGDGVGVGGGSDRRRHHCLSCMERFLCYATAADPSPVIRDLLVSPSDGRHGKASQSGLWFMYRLC